MSSASTSTESRPRQVLDRRRILQAALEFVDAHGLEALSMRKLGALLGVEAMAIYYHVPSKAALVEGMLGLVLEELELPSGPIPGQWTDIVRAAARSYRALALRHANLFPLIATIGFENQASLAPTELLVDVLCRAGLRPDEAFIAFVALKSYVVGHALWVIGDASGARRNADVCELLPELPPEQYPRLAATSEALGDQNVDANFERGLDLLIDGIRARLADR